MEQKSTSAGEIDLGNFFRWIGTGFSSLGKGFVMTLARLRKIFADNGKYFLIWLLAGLAAGVIYLQFIEKNFYSSSMILKSDYLNSRIIENSIGKLNELCEEKDREGLASTLKIGTETAKNIKSFSSEHFLTENELIGSEILKDQLTRLLKDQREAMDADQRKMVENIVEKIEIAYIQSFKIEVEVYDPQVVQALEEALVNFFRSNPYVSKRIASREVFLVKRVEKMARESRKLDSLKKVFYENFEKMAEQSLSGKNNAVISDKYFFDPVRIYDTDLAMDEKISELKDEMSIKPYFEVVDGLTAFRKPDNFSLPVLLILSSIGSILIGLLLLGLKHLNTYLRSLTAA